MHWDLFGFDSGTVYMHAAKQSSWLHVNNRDLGNKLRKRELLESCENRSDQ